MKRICQQHIRQRELLKRQSTAFDYEWIALHYNHFCLFAPKRWTYLSSDLRSFLHHNHRDDDVDCGKELFLFNSKRTKILSSSTIYYSWWVATKALNFLLSYPKDDRFLFALFVFFFFFRCGIIYHLCCCCI